MGKNMEKEKIIFLIIICENMKENIQMEKGTEKERNIFEMVV